MDKFVIGRVVTAIK